MSGTRPVLVGVRDAHEMVAALTWGIEEARSRQVQLTIVHVLPTSLPDPRVGQDEPAAVTAFLIARAEQLVLTAWPEADLAVEVAAGDPIEILLERAEHVSLTVVGPPHAHHVQAAILGSTGALVATHSPGPTVVVRAPAPRGGQDPQVVVGVDHDESAELTLGYAFDHAARHALPVHAVAVWETDRPCRGGVAVGRTLDVDPDWLGGELAVWRARYPGVAAHASILRDRVAPALLSCARPQDLMVLGRHGRDHRGDTFLSSTAQSVLQHATCPVAVVPTG